MLLLLVYFIVKYSMCLYYVTLGLYGCSLSLVVMPKEIMLLLLVYFIVKYSMCLYYVTLGLYGCSL